MKRLFARSYWFLYRKAIERAEPDPPKRIILKEILIHLIRFAIRYYKQ